MVDAKQRQYPCSYARGLIMKPLELFRIGLREKAFYELEWILAMFSVTLNKSPKIADYPYRIVRTDDAVGYLDSDLLFQPLKGVGLHDPIIRFDDLITLEPGDIANVSVITELTCGEALVNAAVLSYAFGNKIPCIAGYMDFGKIEQEIANRLTTDVPLEEEQADRIYVREYKEYTKAMFHLTPLNDIAVPSASPRNVTSDPEIKRLRNELITRLGPNPSPLDIARAEKKFEAMDRAWTNDYGKTFFTQDKEYNNARKKRHTWVGYEVDFLDPNKGTMIYKSLDEGIDFDNFPALVNSARDASFNRGYLTMLGGSAVKQAIQATQNCRVVEGFCGTTIGLPTIVDEENKKNLVDFYSIERGTYKLITADNVNQLVGKKVLVGSPGMCKLKHPDVCSVCVGVTNAANPRGLSAAIANISSVFMNVFMKKMHVSTISYIEFDPKRSFL